VSVNGAIGKIPKLMGDAVSKAYALCLPPTQLKATNEVKSCSWKDDTSLWAVNGYPGYSTIT
jgi:hypothetical protein